MIKLIYRAYNPLQYGNIITGWLKWKEQIRKLIKELLLKVLSLLTLEITLVQNQNMIAINLPIEETNMFPFLFYYKDTKKHYYSPYYCWYDSSFNISIF